MRKNVFDNTRIGMVQQGMIFNGGVSDSYSNSKVHGVLVTPRCDIENLKVRTYHYLPIVEFTDWYYQDMWIIFSAQIKKQMKNNIINEFVKHGISPDILDFCNPDEIIAKNLLHISVVH